MGSTITGILTLIPFFLGVFTYFYFPPKELPYFQRASIKCFPILALVSFLYLRKTESSVEYKCKNLILFGLLFSCIGDAFLLTPNLFLAGMIAFALAHVMYILALGFELVELKYGVLLYGICTIMVFILMPGLDGPLVYGVPIYGYILATMVWCALGAMKRSKVDSWWIANITGWGAVLWMTSDALLAYNKFVNRIPYEDILIMVTYYLGQLSITLSSFVCWKSYNQLQQKRKC